jgi:hypothetical protein
MKIIPFLIGAFMLSATASLAQAAPEPPFYGVWSCTMINDGNTIDVSHWWQERFDAWAPAPRGRQMRRNSPFAKSEPTNFHSPTPMAEKRRSS